MLILRRERNLRRLLWRLRRLLWLFGSAADYRGRTRQRSPVFLETPAEEDSSDRFSMAGGSKPRIARITRTDVSSLERRKYEAALDRLDVSDSGRARHTAGFGVRGLRAAERCGVYLRAHPLSHDAGGALRAAPRGSLASRLSVRR